MLGSSGSRQGHHEVPRRWDGGGGLLLKSAASWLRRLVDVRRGEGATVGRASAALFLIVGAQIALETARDALLLSRFPARELAVVYVAVALSVLPAAGLAGRMVARVGMRRTLTGALLVTALSVLALFLAPVTRASLIALYVASGLVAAILVPLFWNLAGAAVSIAQGRRLLSLVSAAGVLGGLAGSGAALAMQRAPVTALLVLSAGGLMGAALLVPLDVVPARPATASDSAKPGVAMMLRGEPFVGRIAALVALSTIAGVLLDYFFKWTVARSMPPERMPAFVARYYAALNLATLVAQLVIGRLLIRRHGAIATIALAPLVLVAGAIGSVTAGGRTVAVLVLKGLDTVVRGAVNRVSTELLYLPLSPETRDRTKPLIDGALVRTIQALMGATLLLVALAGRTSGRLLGVGLLVVGGLWLVAAWRARTPYLALLRRSLGREPLTPWVTADPLDIETAEALVEHLSHDEPAMVLGAMNALVRRGHLRLLPALILLHPDEGVVVRALSLLARKQRGDWFSLARKLLDDPRERVRLEAARALAAHSQLDTAALAENASGRARRYASLHAALQREDLDPYEDPAIAATLTRSDSEAEADRLDLAVAIADSQPNPRLGRLLAELTARPNSLPAWNREISRAISAQQAVDQVPFLISLLASRSGRDAVEVALASFGDEALAVLTEALHDPTTPRAVRGHIPPALTRFGSKAVAELLLETIEGDADGLVRYRALRALGRIVAERGLKVDRQRVERLALANLVEYFRLLAALRQFEAKARPADTSGDGERTEHLLVGLLDDKLRQSLARVFRLLKVAHPREDLHRVHDAYLSQDRQARAHAAEFISALLDHRDQTRLRELLRACGEEATPADALERARELLDLHPPRTPEEAIEALVLDRDSMVAGLAQLHSAALSGKSARIAVGSAEMGAIDLVLDSHSPVSLGGLP